MIASTLIDGTTSTPRPPSPKPSTTRTSLSPTPQSLNLTIGGSYLTPYGSCVLIRIHNRTYPSSNNDASATPYEVYEVRIWRTPFHSVASTSVAFLRGIDFLEVLPCSTGMTCLYTDTDTDTDTGDSGEGGGEGEPGSEVKRKVMIHTYNPRTSEFQVSDIIVPNPADNITSTDYENAGEQQTSLPLPLPIQNTPQTPPTLYRVPKSKFTPSLSSKFYPLIILLMERSDRLVKTSTPMLKSTLSKGMKKFTEVETMYDAKGGLNGLIENGVGSGSDGGGGSVEEQVDGLKTGAMTKLNKTLTPKNTTLLIQTLKDTDIQILLLKSQKRLNQLTSEIPSDVTKVLENSGIEILQTTGKAINNDGYRRDALNALNNLMSDLNINIDTDYDTVMTSVNKKDVQKKINEHWVDVMSTLGNAGITDEFLGNIVNTFSAKTSELQEMTGKLSGTKSIATFLKGAERLKKRTSLFLTDDRISTFQKSSQKIFERLSAGDDAVAKVKGLELGNTLKAKLIQSLEIQSESKGGLDGIIAAALSSVSERSSKLGLNDITKLVEGLQSNASSKSLDANEALLSVLSKKSVYREDVLLKIEESMIKMNDQIVGVVGETLSSEDIIAIATGEKGTAKLFAPIAVKATAEFDKQLSLAENSISNKSALSVLKYIRQIVNVKGGVNEGTIKGVLDDAVNVLNDDSSVRVGESVVKRGEQMLDIIESASKHEAFASMISAMRKAGMTEEAMFKRLEALNVNELMNSAESVITDSQARKNLVAGATDSALDFLLTVLPSMSVPPLDGSKDGTLYSIKNLSMNGFKIRKEDIKVQIAGITSTTKAGATVLEGIEGLTDENEVPVMTPSTPSELVIIEVSNIQALINDITWSFEQTFFPYAKGQGEADATIVNANLLLKFELRKKPKLTTGGSSSNKGKAEAEAEDELLIQEWEPVLCLSSHICTIERVQVSLRGDGMTWLYNMLAALFKTLLRDYVVKSVLETVLNSSGYLLETMNDNLSQFWPLILDIAKLDLASLPEIDETSITDSTKNLNENVVELVWRESLPLGIQLLMNDGSGEVKVVEFPRGGQARRVAEMAKVDPDLFKGATISAVNGRKFGGMAMSPTPSPAPSPASSSAPVSIVQKPIDTSKIDAILAALKEPGRPKSIEFEVSAADGERITLAVGRAAKNKNSVIDKKLPIKRVAKRELYEVVITEKGPLGITFGVGDELGLQVVAFKPDCLHSAALEGVKTGFILTHVNGELVLGTETLKVSTDKLKVAGDVRPLRLSFAEPCVITKTFMHSSPVNSSASSISPSLSLYGCPSEELILTDNNSNAEKASAVLISGFLSSPGPFEAGGAQCGDIIIAVNGKSFSMDLKSATKSEDLKTLLATFPNESSYPMIVEFARPKDIYAKDANKRLDNFRFMMEIPCKVDLGATFQRLSVSSQRGMHNNSGDGESTDFLNICKFRGVKGPVQRILTGDKGVVLGMNEVVGVGMKVYKCNGHFVPLSANAKDVIVALTRGWADDGGKVEVGFKDLEHEGWLESLL